MEKWTQTKSHTVHQDRWISLRADECLLPDGRVVSPYYVLEEPDWVNIIAFNSKGEVLVTTQYRYAGDSVCLEIPCGGVEPCEEPLEAAKRELREETGYEADQWELVISPFANPARQTNRDHCFYANGLRKVGEQNLDEHEAIDFAFMPIEELKEKIHSGTFSQALHIAAFYATLDYRKHERTSKKYKR